MRDLGCWGWVGFNTVIRKWRERRGGYSDKTIQPNRSLLALHRRYGKQSTFITSQA